MPDEFKERGSCDDETMVVRCAKANYVIAVYNVTMTYKEGCRATKGKSKWWLLNLQKPLHENCVKENENLDSNRDQILIVH